MEKYTGNDYLNVRRAYRGVRISIPIMIMAQVFLHSCFNVHRDKELPRRKDVQAPDSHPHRVPFRYASNYTETRKEIHQLLTAGLRDTEP